MTIPQMNVIAINPIANSATQKVGISANYARKVANIAAANVINGCAQIMQHHSIHTSFAQIVLKKLPKMYQNY